MCCHWLFTVRKVTNEFIYFLPSLQVFHSIQRTCMELLKVIEQYQRRICCMFKQTASLFSFRFVACKCFILLKRPLLTNSHSSVFHRLSSCNSFFWDTSLSTSRSLWRLMAEYPDNIQKMTLCCQLLYNSFLSDLTTFSSKHCFPTSTKDKATV